MPLTPSVVNGPIQQSPQKPNGNARCDAKMTRDGAFTSVNEMEKDDNTTYHLLKARWAQTEAKLSALFGRDGRIIRGSKDACSSESNFTSDHAKTSAATEAAPATAHGKSSRYIHDDYDDSEDDESADESPARPHTPKPVGKAAVLPNGGPHVDTRSPFQPGKLHPSQGSATAPPHDPAQSTEDVRKQLEEDKKAAAEAAKRSFQSMFYTLEHDRDAMFEQQKLDELDREVENEISGGANGNLHAQAATDDAAGHSNAHGSLGNADLGASSLTLKHLVARIDAKRHMIKVSDNVLRSLISDVRKGRSKWASEDRVGQEELYEAAEKVLMELKAQTEYVQPFLQRVSKRDVPDYHNVIKAPMDIGTMLKKLKQTSYKSKSDFVHDLNLIWANCLKYNQDPAHPLRKKALYMRKETEKLVPLIPEIVVRDRAEVEAEEQRLNAVDADDSDDDSPIMASRGRKAPTKGGKTAPSGTKRASTGAVDGASPNAVPDTSLATTAPALNIPSEAIRVDSDMHDVSSQDRQSLPPADATPSVANGTGNPVASAGQADVIVIEIDANRSSPSHEDAGDDESEFKTWRQVTKKDRAQAASQRNRLFRCEHSKYLNPEEPALIRTKAMMRRWVRQQKLVFPTDQPADAEAEASADAAENGAQGESLAEGIEKEEDSTLPDYYTSLSAIPELSAHLAWKTDSEGYVAPQAEEWMRMFPTEQFRSPNGNLARKVEANMRQMQDTRKICSKIGVVKQMQIQAQTYQNQFQKYEPAPFVERDIGPIVVSGSGPVMAPSACRRALQRTVGKVFYHAGFEDFQPAALDAVTDLASEYFTKLVETFKCFHEQPRSNADTPAFSFEEEVLHTLFENGADLDGLESYVKEDVDRLGTKLGVVHERMKRHLADMLRPALGEHAGQDGVGAFHDGSEQFVGGDFAEDLDEDFFGFRELGLAEELGLESLSVPLHLLQNRMHSAYQAQHQGPIVNTGVTFGVPDPYEPITKDTVNSQIGLVQDFFRNKLHNNHDEPLVEDEDLPQKQRFPKPRLPPTGKISSPRKRPIREQQQAAKKRRKLDESASCQ